MRSAAHGRTLASGLVLTLAVACSGGAEDAVPGVPDDWDGRDVAEICELLAAAELPEGMSQDTYEELLEGFRLLCDRIGVPLPPSGGPTGGGGDGPTSGSGGATAGGDAGGGSTDGQGADGGRTDAELIGLDPFDDDVRRRAIAAGPQCDPASVDLSMSEVMKAPAIGPMGSPPFDAALAIEQYRAPALCLPEPYRSEWLVIAAAYEPVFELLEAYSDASNRGPEALIELGAQLADIEQRLSALGSAEVESAVAAMVAFFDELRSSGAWDAYDEASPWGSWWDSAEFREFWSDAQSVGAWSGLRVPDLPAPPGP